MFMLTLSAHYTLLPREKKQRSEPKHGGKTSSDVCKEKKDGSIAGEDVENKFGSAKLCGTNNVSEDGVKKYVQ